MSDRLRINTLHRFAKHSERLVLHQYSHCEVPAGCGGYVLRWHNPEAGVPLLLEVACPGRIESFLDGRPMQSSRLVVPAGIHLLALHVSGLSSLPAPLALIATLDMPRELSGFEPVTTFASAAVAGWRAVGVPPGERWGEPDFDDRTWRPLVEMAVSEKRLGEQWRHYDPLLRRGARALRLDRAAVWIRGRITVEAPR